MEIVSRIYVCVPVGPHSSKSSDLYVVYAFPVVICASLYEGMFENYITSLKFKCFFQRHSDHREFLCANCGKQFKRKDKLKEHMKRMHSAERELRLAMKPHRTPTAKKFMPKVQVKLSCTATLFIFLVVVWEHDEMFILC